MDRTPVLVVGATGYVGIRLVAHLREKGWRVRAAARSLKKMEALSWAGDPGVEPVRADVFDRETLAEACEGCSAAYYLVHSMGSPRGDFSRADREGAANMVWAAEQARLDRIIYLGGLGEDGETLSEHLRSRDEVGKILQAGKVPATVLRAAMIIGSGSGSFEILRYLVDRLPVMITPRWVDTESQPIPIRSVLAYLSGCLEVPETAGGTFDIGGPEIVTYRRLMRIYAEEARLPRRLILPVPVLTPRLSAYWIHLVTPMPAALARPLAEGLSNRVVCRDDRIRPLIPQELLDCRHAIRLAVANSRRDIVEPEGEGPEARPPESTFPGDAPWGGGTSFHDHRRVVLEATPEEAWEPIGRIGGEAGWYFADWLWRLRGVLDRLAGGVGMRRDRKEGDALRPGDPVDFWRVRAVSPGRYLVLIAEMALPGCAVLSFRIRKIGHRTVEIEQRSCFVPKGLGGILYWVAVSPVHRFVFQGMLRGIASRTGKPVVRGPEAVAHSSFPVGAASPGEDAA
ncbi:MAG TPA: SDR family oxidoreductase [Candidatus Deferrimicrobiaceae bacterium]|nr:SDR family oxidoreductase [Candidatus Deferrimicrobiaceae bacterium]